MDAEKIDGMSRQLAGLLSRRRLLAVALGVAGGQALGARDADAAMTICRRLGQQCTRGGQCCSGICDAAPRSRNQRRYTCGCPSNERACRQTCTAVLVDPENCGGCGVACDPMVADTCAPVPAATVPPAVWARPAKTDAAPPPARAAPPVSVWSRSRASVTSGTTPPSSGTRMHARRRRIVWTNTLWDRAPSSCAWQIIASTTRRSSTRRTRTPCWVCRSASGSTMGYDIRAHDAVAPGWSRPPAQSRGGR